MTAHHAIRSTVPATGWPSRREPGADRNDRPHGGTPTLPRHGAFPTSARLPPGGDLAPERGGGSLALNQVWIETQDHGLVRADQVVEVLAHQTTAFSGKPARWLLDVVIAVSQGAGTTSQWNVGASHRTLAQTGDE